jgi:hypothetical protein
MTFWEVVGVIEICVLSVCAIPTTGIVARDRSAAQVEDNFLMGRVALSRTFQGYPAESPGRFPDPANSLPDPVCTCVFMHTDGLSAVLLSRGEKARW